MAFRRFQIGRTAPRRSIGNEPIGADGKGKKKRRDKTWRCAVLEVEALEGEVRLDDAGGFDARAQHVLLRRHVRLRRDAVQRVQVVGGAVVQLVLARPREAVLHAAVHPQPLHHLPKTTTTTTMMMMMMMVTETTLEAKTNGKAERFSSASFPQQMAVGPFSGFLD